MGVLVLFEDILITWFVVQHLIRNGMKKGSGRGIYDIPKSAWYDREAHCENLNKNNRCSGQIRKQER